MKTHTAPYVAVMLIVLGTFSTVPRTPDPAVRVDSNAIGGVVTGPSGPEAGVWVIAETSELATKFVKIVVTDDQGRYLLPDLPKATYRVAPASPLARSPAPTRGKWTRRRYAPRREKLSISPRSWHQTHVRLRVFPG